MQQLFDHLITSLWAPATYAKLLFLALTAPFWWPLARVMYREILPALNATGDATPARRKPGEDPFLNIPLASHRARRAHASAGATLGAAARRRRGSSQARGS
jgi:hypothetical protein